MSDFKEQIKTREDSLKAGVNRILEGVVQNNPVQMDENIRYDEELRAREVSVQEKFRKYYRTNDAQAQDDILINAPVDYAPEDVVVQERKYGYFSNTRKSRITQAKTQKAAWKTAIDKYASNTGKNGLGFDMGEKVTEDAMDFMLSTKRLAAIENKKSELAAQILTPEALNALKESNAHAGEALETYRTSILNLGPSIEVVPDPNETVNSEVSFTEESVESYRAYLRFVSKDPIGAMEAAITDSLHQLTSFPEKMLGTGAIPQTFDRLMQVRNRFSAINKFRRLRQRPKDVKDDNPVGKLMTKLYPREDEAAEGHDDEGQEHEGHEHDERSNFKLINLMETAINSDLVTCLKKAGIKHRADLFGLKKNDPAYIKKNSKYIDTDGNSALELMTDVKKGLSEETDETKEAKRKLNASHWKAREQAAYDQVKKNREEAQNAGAENDAYGIMQAVNKIKTDAAGKQKIKYNTDLAGQLENRITRLSVTIDGLRTRVRDENDALALDSVKMSRELTARMKANALKDQYDLMFLLDRVKGYLNAYDHTVSGRELDVHGTAVMDEMRENGTYDDGENEWVSIATSRLDVRYNTDNVARMNRVARDGENVPEPKVESDRDAVTQVRNKLISLDKNSDKLLADIRNINANNQNAVIDDLIAFRSEVLKNNRLVSFALKGQRTNAFTSMVTSLEAEEDRNGLMNEYIRTMSKCAYLCAYAEAFRLDNIIGTFTGDKLPDGIELTETERAESKGTGLKYFKDRRAELSHQMDIRLKEITGYENARLASAGNRNLFNVDPEAGQAEVKTALETFLSKIDLNKYSDEKYVPAVEQPPVIEHEEPPHEEEQERKPATRKVKKKVRMQRVKVVGGKRVVVDTFKEIEVEEPIPEGELEQEEPEIEEIPIIQNLNEIEQRKKEERKRKEREEQERLEQERLERERLERERLEREHRAGGRDDNINNGPYVKRIVNPQVETILAEGSLKTMYDHLAFFAQHLGIVNRINIVTWDELKAEVRAWMMGRKIGRVTVTEDNVDALMEEGKKAILQFRNDLVVDASGYNEEDKAGFDDSNLEDKVFEANTAGDIVKAAIECDSDETAAVFGTRELPENADDILKEFMIDYAGSFKNSVAQKDAGVQEAEKGHIKWFLNNLPEEITVKSMSDFRHLWNRKIGYDYLNGKPLSEKTWKKLKCVFESFSHAIDTAKLVPEAQQKMEKTRQTDLNAPTPDHMIENYNKDALNIHQWYGASCWATSGTVISNWYMKNVLGLENPPLVDQETFLHPDVVKLNPYAEEKMRMEMKDSTGSLGLAREKANIESFVKQGGQFGSLISAADVFLQNMSNTAVRHLRWNLPNNDQYFNSSQFSRDDWKHFAKQFFNKVSDLLKSGSGPISMLLPGHYRTIIGVEGNILKCRDSGNADGAVEKTFTLEEFTTEFLSRRTRENGYSFELLYLQKIDEERKEELKQSCGAEYDEEGKLKYDREAEKKDAAISENMIHNLGVMYEVNANRERTDLLDQFMTERVYVPKNLDHTRNVEEVNKERDELRKQLELPDMTQREIKARDAKIKAYETQARSKRAERAELWRKYAVPAPLTEEEKRAREEEMNRRIDEEIKQFQVLGSYKEFEKDLINTRELRQTDEVFAEKGEKLQDKYKDYHKELISKTKNFYKRRRANATAEKKDKKNRVKPTALDVLDADYMQKEEEQDNARMMGEEIAGDQPFGWVLTPQDMANIGGMIGKKGAGFASELTKDKESSVRKRNEALNAVKSGDVSKYNNLSTLLREYFGRKELDKFFGEDKDYKEGRLPKLTPKIKERLNGKTRDPIFRGAINLMMSRMSLHKKYDKQLKALREYDAYMNQQLIVQTLAPVEDTEIERLKAARTAERTAKSKLRAKYAGYKKSELTNEMKNALKDEENAIASEVSERVTNELADNSIRQRHMAKMMFIMQLGRFDRFDTKGSQTHSKAYDLSISEALAHGNRVGISLPAGTAGQQEDLRNAWKGNVTDAMMPGRMATHELSRRRINDPDSSFKEIKVGFSDKATSKKLTTISDNYGLNLPLGGLGKEFNGGRSVIEQNGRFGHMYQKYRKGDEKTCGGMLIGVENAAPGGLFSFTNKLFGGFDGTSAIGEVHNFKAIGHKQSAFYSGKMDDGDKYSGRVVDLSHMDAGLLTRIINAFDTKYATLQRLASITVKKTVAKTGPGKKLLKVKADAVKTLNMMNQILSGRVLTASQLLALLKSIGIEDGPARDAIVTGRSAEHAGYVPSEDYSPKEENKNNIGVTDNVELQEFLKAYQEVEQQNVQNNGGGA